jgi:tetratricopeptide (TPR) repeat protein
MFIYPKHSFSFAKKITSPPMPCFGPRLIFPRRPGGWHLRGHGLWGIGKNLMIQGHHREALPWLEEALTIFEGEQARLAIAMVWGELAVCYLGLGDDQKALDLFRGAERINLECGVVHNYQVTLANIGNVYLHRGDHFTAISYYQRALALARQIQGSGLD